MSGAIARRYAVRAVPFRCLPGATSGPRPVPPVAHSSLAPVTSALDWLAACASQEETAAGKDSGNDTQQSSPQQSSPVAERDQMRVRANLGSSPCGE